jgi:hypothetical protein
MNSTLEKDSGHCIVNLFHAFLFHREVKFIVTVIDAISCGGLQIVRPMFGAPAVKRGGSCRRSPATFAFPCVISNRQPDLQASTVSSVNLNGRLLTGLNLYDVLVSGRSRRVVLSSKSKRTGYRDSLHRSKLKLGTSHFDARWAEAGALETLTRPSRCLNHRSHGLASFPMERCSGRGGYKDPEAPLSAELFLQLLSIYIL